MAKTLREPVQRRTGYHHGNLKDALITAARRLIAERGPRGFTLVEAARLANVSPAAPYRHFNDRDALLAEVCRRGAAQFAERLALAWRGGTKDPVAAFQRMGGAYLAFAREEPGYYGAMFSWALGPKNKKTDKKYESFAALMRAIESVAPASSKAADRELVAFLVWALSHGVATLSAAGQIPGDKGGAGAETALKLGVGALMHGLILLGDSGKVVPDGKKSRASSTKTSTKTRTAASAKARAAATHGRIQAR